MHIQSVMRKLLAVFLLCALSYPASAFDTVIKDKSSPASQQERGWDTLTGTLIQVEMDRFEQTDWKEIALRAADGTLTVLIGEKVASLQPEIGKEVTVTGVYKPRMSVKGKPTPVLEVRFVDRIKE